LAYFWTYFINSKFKNTCLGSCWSVMLSFAMVV
jgi:hypothetical protein